MKPVKAWGVKAPEGGYYGIRFDKKWASQITPPDCVLVRVLITEIKSKKRKKQK